MELKAEQDEIKEALGNEYQDYNLVMATTFGLPIGDSYLRNKMQDIIDELGLPDVVFHSLRHTSVTYKLKLSGGDIKAVQGDSGHAQADMVTEAKCGILLCGSADLGPGGRFEKEKAAAEISIRAIIKMEVGGCPLFL